MATKSTKVGIGLGLLALAVVPVTMIPGVWDHLTPEAHGVVLTLTFVAFCTAVWLCFFASGDNPVPATVVPVTMSPSAADAYVVELAKTKAEEAERRREEVARVEQAHREAVAALQATNEEFNQHKATTEAKHQSANAAFEKMERLFNKVMEMLRKKSAEYDALNQRRENDLRTISGIREALSDAPSIGGLLARDVTPPAERIASAMLLLEQHGQRQTAEWIEYLATLPETVARIGKPGPFAFLDQLVVDKNPVDPKGNGSA